MQSSDFITSQLALTLIIEGVTGGASTLDKVFVSSCLENFSTHILDRLYTSDHNKISQHTQYSR